MWSVPALLDHHFFRHRSGGPLHEQPVADVGRLSGPDDSWQLQRDYVRVGCVDHFASALGLFLVYLSVAMPRVLELVR